MIDLMLKEMVGPDDAAAFWRAFKDNYITRDDIRYIASTGANTIRLPFNYKLFTDEDYMGLSAAQDGFARVDSVVEWCRESGLYLILDMHDCPGGQTGDNIDNGHGYPWLFESEVSQQLFIKVWCDIARRYKDEPVILGYELMNEPIAHYFENKEELNKKLEPLYKRTVKAIREIDKTTSYCSAERSGTAISICSPTGSSTQTSCTHATATAVRLRQMPSGASSTSATRPAFRCIWASWDTTLISGRPTS